jgi:Pvc16 N-terminal domain
MSNGLAIAAVSATLRQLLIDGLQITNVTVRSPDKARDGFDNDQVNLFLYHAEVDGAWRNMDMPRTLKPGETGYPPLPLTLYYLLTAFSDDTNEVKNHMLLGRAMGVLHDHPLLGAEEIQSATGGNVPGSDLHEQIERVRITHQPLPLEEVSKLWSAFQTQYRTSVAYQVSVVLIESRRPAKTPLPVLKRGQDDTGVTSQADVTSPFPTLLEIEFPGQQFSARLGDTVTLRGLHLDAGALEVRFSNLHLADPGPVTIEPGGTDKEIRVTLTDDPQKWVAGIYMVSVVVTDGDDVRSTNELPLTVAPRITTALPLDVLRDGDEKAEIDLTFSPQFRPGQRGALLIGGREVAAEPLPTPPDPPDPTDTLKFIVKQAPLGEHFLRLRIDGVDSLLVQRPEGQPPVFDTTQRVTIHD